MNNIPDDIPEAQRDSWDQSSTLTGSRTSPLLWLGMGSAAIALGVGTALLWQAQPFGMGSSSKPAAALQASSFLRKGFANLGLTFASGIAPASDGDRSDTISQDADSSQPQTSESEVGLLGHRAYEEAPAETLIPIVADGSIRLRATAAPQFQQMVAAARADGVSLVPLSGFRSVEEQQYLFFGIKAERGLRAEDRATVSAPPGYSEHHTGYAIDIGDGNQPETNFEQSFETTAAFRWLRENAAFYSFELSFEKGEPGLVSYEPWQWRFVGDRHSLETFYGTAGEPASSSASRSSRQPQSSQQSQ